MERLRREAAKIGGGGIERGRERKRKRKREREKNK